MTRLSAVPEQPRRGVGLIRVSKARGREDLTSPELQRTAIEDYAARRGIVVTQWVEGLDESGSQNSSRWWRTLDGAVTRVEQGEFDAVLVWKFSRAARHRRRWAVAVDRIETAGGTLESATEGVDTTTSTGRFTRGMLAEMAAFEAERIGEVWEETHERRRKLGLPPRGGDRFGYVRDGDTYTPDPATSPVLAFMYERYLAGAGFVAIADELNRAGIQTTAGLAWTRTRVTIVLDSGFAAGQLVSGRGSKARWIPGAQPAVISAQTWQAYQQARRRRAQEPPTVTEPVYVLSGLIRCGDEGCGAPMHAAKLGREAGYGYVCSRWAQTRQGRCVTVSRAKAEQAVLDHLTLLVSDLEREADRAAARAAEQVMARQDIKALARQVLRLDERLTKLTIGWTDGLVPDGAYIEARDDLLEQKRAGERELLRLEAETTWRERPALPIARGLLLEWPTLPVRERREMLRALIRCVRVIRPENGRVRVEVEPL